MLSIKSTRAFAAQAALLLSLGSLSLAQTYKGCFSSSQGLTDQGSYTYQALLYCQPLCVGKNAAVLGFSGGSDCWCGNELPPTDALVDDSNCDTNCNGYPSDKCGGTNFYSIYLTGTEADVPNAGSSGSSSSGSSSSSTSSSEQSSSSSASQASNSPTRAPSPTTSTQSSASVVTSVAPGKTVVVTQPAAPEKASATPSETTAPSGKKKSGSNTAAIAAGVVVGIVVAAAIIGALVFWIRHKKRKQAEADYNRHQNGFTATSERKTPGLAGGWSNLSDSRLDPEAGRRNSSGSIADDQDYSRRILRVANPS